MKNKNFTVAQYLHSLENAEAASNFGGEMEEQFTQNDMEFADSESEFAGGALRVAKPWVITISNSTASTANAVLFGYNDNFNQTNFGSPVALTIASGVSGVPYRRLLAQTQNKPFNVGYWRLTSSSSSQLSQVITINYVDANGRSAADPVPLSIYQDSYQNLTTVLDIRNYPFKIDGNTSLTVPVLGSVTDLVIIMFPDAISDPARPLTGGGQNIEKGFANPKLSGLNTSQVIIKSGAPINMANKGAMIKRAR